MFEAAGLSPDRVVLFGDFSVPQTMITLWIVSAVIIIAAIIFKVVFFKKFKEEPEGLQNVVELIVEFVGKMCKTNLEGRGRVIAPYILTLGLVLIASGLVELMGVRAPATDLSFTCALAILTFIWINAYGVCYKGLGGRLSSFGKPIKFIYPIKALTHIASPISLACRLFGNLFSGLIIMELIYFALGYFAVGIPAVLSIYFNLFHIAMQTYVFIILTLSFINEAIE